jgi:serine/threonine protein kinase
MISDPNGLSEFDSVANLLPAFEFEGVIARGAAGTIYKARQRSLDRAVAIRIIPQEQSNGPAFHASFMAGVKAMANFSHPSLIRVFDFGEVEGFSYMVMEYVPGKSLHHSAQGRAIEPRQAAQIIIGACHGLAHAHEKGIIHGGIKPTDILLTPKCEPKIGNFGFTRHSRGESGAYMAHELVDGVNFESPQSDVYAMGMVFQELLTGIPAGAVDAERIVFHDARLAEVCRKATHPDPALRFSDATALAEAIKEWMSPDISKIAPRPRQASACRSKPAAVPGPARRVARSMLRNCAVIGFLLFAVNGLWSVYKDKQETLVRLHQAEDAIPRIIEMKVEAGKETHLGMETATVQWESEP